MQALRAEVGGHKSLRVEQTGIGYAIANLFGTQALAQAVEVGAHVTAFFHARNGVAQHATGFLSVDQQFATALWVGVSSRGCGGHGIA